jgi:hypothetical protein
MDLTFKFKKQDGGEKEYCLPLLFITIFILVDGGRHDNT